MELTLAVYVLFLMANDLSMTQIMGLETIFITLVMLLEVPSGAFADLYGRKLSLSLAMVSAGIGFIIFGMGSSFWAFLAAQIIIAFAWSLSSGADSAILYDSLKEEGKEKDFSAVLGRANFAMLMTWAACSLASGFLADIVGYRALFFASAAFFFISAIIAAWMVEPPIHQDGKKREYLKHLQGALSFSYDNRRVRRLILYYGLFAALTHLSWFVIQPFLDKGGASESLIGIALSLYFISAGIGNLVAKRMSGKIRGEILFPGLLCIASISLIGLYFSGWWAALFFIAGLSFTSGVRDVIVNAGIHHETASHHRATVGSVQNMSKSIMYAIFAPIIGYASDLFSPGTAFLLMGTGLLAFTLVYIYMTRQEAIEVSRG